MGHGEFIGQNIGERIGVSGSPIIIDSGNYMANGDVNWLNPPSLPLTGNITQTGGTITISFVKIDAATVRAIQLANLTNVSINNCEITNATSDSIFLSGCSNVSIRNNKLANAGNPTLFNYGYGIYLYQCFSNVSVYGNWIEDCAGGVRIDSCNNVDNYSVKRNFIKNNHRVNNQGEDVFFTYCANMTNTEVVENVGRSIFTECEQEDHYNVYWSGGTPASPIRIANNRIRGGGPSGSGGGCLGIDNGKANHGYLTIENNRLVDPGQYGLGMTGGHNVIINNNDIFSSINYEGVHPANVGLYVYRQAGTAPGDMYDGTVTNNRVLFWADKNDTGTPIKTSNYHPTDTGGDGQSPNHGTLAAGNSKAIGYDSTNDWDYTAWDADGGNAGYALLPVPDAWEYYAPE